LRSESPLAASARCLPVALDGLFATMQFLIGSQAADPRRRADAAGPNRRGIADTASSWRPNPRMRQYRKLRTALMLGQVRGATQPLACGRTAAQPVPSAARGVAMQSGKSHEAIAGFSAMRSSPTRSWPRTTWVWR
jgi:hypothetical protein